MIRQEIGMIGGKKAFACQCETLDEMKKEKFPTGVSFCWEIDGQRVFNAYEILLRVQGDVKAGQTPQSKMINREYVKTFHNKLFAAQQKQIINALESAKKDYKEIPGMQSTIDSIDKMIDAHKTRMPFPDESGVFRPTRVQAEELAGGKENLDFIYNEEEQKELFGEGVK